MIVALPGLFSYFFCSAGRSKAVVPVLVLLFVAFAVNSAGRFVLCLALCCFVLVFFSHCSIAVALLGEGVGVGGGGGGGSGEWGRKAGLGAFRAVVRFVLVWICRFPLPLGVWEGMRFMIVALPVLFSYSFFIHCV